MKLRQEPLSGDDSVAAALCGPLVLAADLDVGPVDGSMRMIHNGDTVPKNLPSTASLPKVAAAQDKDTKQWIQVESQSELCFTAAGESAKYDLIPIYQIRDQRYSIYCQTGNSKQRTQPVNAWLNSSPQRIVSSCEGKGQLNEVPNYCSRGAAVRVRRFNSNYPDLAYPLAFDIVTRKFKLEQADQAYRLMASGKCGKVAVCPGGE